jgi:hypothetical protein
LGFSRYYAYIMCFSATASFVAGGVLSAAGVVTVQKATRKELALASIPLLLGAQQLIDGIVWITPDTSITHVIAAYAYSVFAFAFWPLFVPIALLLIETDIHRKRVLEALFILGVGLSAFFLYYILLHGVTASFLRNCIAYTTPHPYTTLSLAFYLVAVCGPFIVSSIKILRIFGLTLLLSFAIAGWFYIETFSSTWCFFAAVLSGILLLHFYPVRKKLTD